MSRPSLVAAVWATRPSGPKRRDFSVGIVAAVALHVAILVGMWRTGPSLEMWAADMAILVHQDLVRIEAVDIERPTPPPAAPKPAEPERERPARPERPPAADASPPEPAEAAQVVAADAPVDLTQDVVVTGEGSRYAGGSTHAEGKSQTMQREPVSPPPKPKAPSPAKTAATNDRSRSARPSSPDWACPWPRAAEGLDIYEESAIVSVRVDARGRALDVRIVRDPGHGFGTAALECARRARFEPALDRAGNPVASTAPPIRVVFER